jgi:ABC-type multidrug transport system ATPase subunit
MIYLRNVSAYCSKGPFEHEFVLRNVSGALPTDRAFALLGHDAQALTAVLYMLAGAKAPHEGEVLHSFMRKSPLIQAGGVAGATLVSQFSAADNIRLLADLHSIDRHHLMALVEVACRFGKYLGVPVGKFDRPMRRVLELTVMAALPFDCYFVDGLHRTPAPLTWRLVHAARRRRAGLVFSTTARRQALRIARMGGIVSGGSMRFLYSLDEVLSSDEYAQQAASASSS